MIAYRVTLTDETDNGDGTRTIAHRSVASDADTFRAPSKGSSNHAEDAPGTRRVRGYLGTDYTVPDTSGVVKAWERYLDKLAVPHWSELAIVDGSGTRVYRVFASVASHTLLGRCKYLRIGRDGSNARYRPTLPLRDMR